MTRYTVELLPRAARELRRLGRPQQRRLARHLRRLEFNPKPPGVLKLQGFDGYRLRVGVYRIVYRVEHDKVRVLVLRIGHRRDLYRSLGDG
jgi:mRNA interferase RelE/StbE